MCLAGRNAASHVTDTCRVDTHRLFTSGEDEADLSVLLNVYWHQTRAVHERYQRARDARLAERDASIGKLMAAIDDERRRAHDDV